jgi:hypothetical protein
MALLLTALTLGGWFVWTMIGESEPVYIGKPTPQTDPAASLAEDASKDVIRVHVSLHAGDPTVQWVRLEDARGKKTHQCPP